MAGRKVIDGVQGPDSASTTCPHQGEQLWELGSPGNKKIKGLD